MPQAADGRHVNLKQDERHGIDHPASYYVKIWLLLLVLLVISIAGPMLGHKVLTLVTAFGIAVVKALIVAAFFMHLNIEKRYVWYLLITMILAVLMFFFGTAADIMKYEGAHWNKPSAYLYADEFKKAFGGGEHGHGGAEHDNDEGEEHEEPYVPYGGAPAAAAK